jgi:hypothetical protein
VDHDEGRPVRLSEIDSAVSAWRQGDCVLGGQSFVHGFLPAIPVSEAALAVAGEGVSLVETSVQGLAVLTQTCDIVRTCERRQYVEVAVTCPRNWVHSL